MSDVRPDDRPVLRLVHGAAARSDAALPRAGRASPHSWSHSLPLSDLPTGSDLLASLGCSLDTADPLASAFSRAVRESGVRFELASDVGIVHILRGEEGLGYFQIDVADLRAGRWERRAAFEYLHRAAVSPLAGLVAQLPSELSSPRRLALAPKLRPSAGQLAYMLGLDHQGSLTLTAGRFPGGIQVELQSGGTKAEVAWSTPHRVVLDIAITRAPLLQSGPVR